MLKKYGLCLKVNYILNLMMIKWFDICFVILIEQILYKRYFKKPQLIWKYNTYKQCV